MLQAGHVEDRTVQEIPSGYGRVHSQGVLGSVSAAFPPPQVVDQVSEEPDSGY